MKAASTANRPNTPPVDPEAQAAALWTFVHAKAPHFTLGAARDVIHRLGLRPGEAPKPLAKRLCTALEAHRVALKHTNALQAASRLAGFANWFSNEDDDIHRLSFVTFDGNSVHEEQFRSWDTLGSALRDWADRLIKRGQLPLGVLALNFTGQVLNLTTPVPPEHDAEQQRNQSWPLGTVTSTATDAQWLDGALAALEKLRRYLEEGGHAVLDGYAALRLCAKSHDQPSHPMAVTITDVVNSELVLMREDSEDDPRSGYEIARGDEMTCWHQLELSCRNDDDKTVPVLKVIIPEEGPGAWYAGGARYIWMVETLKPQVFVPGRVTGQLGIPDCERLLRRYNLAKRIHGRTFKHYEHVKRVDYLAGPPETYRVDLHFLLRQLHDAGLTWAGYLEKFDAQPLLMEDKLPVGFIFQFIDDLHIVNPNPIFAKPNLSEMERVDDDGLLRALMPRVDHVRYAAPPDMDASHASDLRTAIEEFAGGLHTHQMITGGGLQMKDELPHFVWATEAEDLRLTSEALELSMYAATIPHLHSTKGLLPEMPGVKTWPWAFGNALFLRFVRAGSAQ